MLFKSTSEYLLSLLIISFLFISSGFSQSPSYLDSLDGKFALQFQITENFSLSNFQGTVFSGKYHFSNRDAVRLGTSLDFGDSNSETDNTIDTLYSEHSKQDGNSFGFSVFAQYIRYLEVTPEISFFGGIGPFFHYDKSSEMKKTFLDTLEVKRESKRTFYSGGLDLLIGVEWWFHKYMSLSAEYGLGLFYSSIETRTTDDYRDYLTKSNIFTISGANVKFGITVYF